MPALTIVLVVQGEQAYVEQCVASVLAQPFADVELIAVDDASTDRAPALLAGLAAGDERLQVVELPERRGRAAALAVALERVTGEHVWVIRTADRLLPGALASVAARLAETAADVLLVGHERDDGVRTRPGRHRTLLSRVAAGEPSPLDAHRGLAALEPVLWDRVVRRELLAGDPLEGAPEPGLAWAALLRADRIAAHPEPAYLRRQLPSSPRESTAAVLDGYDAALRLAAAHPELVPDARRRLVLPALLDAAPGLLERTAERARSQHLAQLSDLVGRHRRGDEPAPRGRVARLRARAIARGDLRAYALLEAATARAAAVRRRRTALARRRAGVRTALRKRRVRRDYARRRRQPIDPDLAVFAAYWYRGYACNPRAIYERACELVPGLRGVWVVTRDRAAEMPEGVDHVVANTPEYYDLIARAKYFINNVNFPNDVVKRPGTVHVMTHHGTPLKRMGLDLRETPVAGQRMDFDALLRRCKRWDFSISSNPLSTLVWERVFPTRHTTLEIGYPRNDVLAAAGDDEVRRIRAALGIRPEQTAVLYAPTHREYRRGYVPTMDVAAVAEALGDGHVLLARTHYFYDGDPHLRELHRAGRIVDVAAHPSVEELCLAADVLVTDYSSIMFDYAVLDRPIVIHAPDYDVYRAVRGTYFDLLAEPPGVVARTDDELVDALRSGAAAGEDAARDRAAFRARFCPWDDGHAAERAVRAIFLGEQVAAVEPIPAVAR